MSRLFYHVMQDNLGNLLFDVTGTMRLAGSGTLATIYGDEALTVVLPNPMTNHPSFGSFKCFLGAGDYDFYMAKGGYTFETLTGVQGHGTMAQQDAHTVAITGGSAVGLTDAQSNRFYAPNRAGNDVTGFVTDIAAAGGTGRFGLYASGTALNYLAGPLGIGGFNPASVTLFIAYLNSEWGLALKPAASGGVIPVLFQNSTGASIGSIATNDTGTAYNTSSDARLKHAIATLAGALDRIRALNPVSFRWNSTDQSDIGFLAHELMGPVPTAVTGQPDEVNDDGSIRPQQVDNSKLVPILVAALKELMARVETLEAQLA